MKKICSVPECNKVYYAKGYCKNHYEKKRYYGELSSRGCTVLGCNKGYYAKGFCVNHYALNIKNGFPGYKPKKYNNTICTVGDCNGKPYAKGLCRNHYDLNLANGFPGYKPGKYDGVICSAKNCNEQAQIKGLCGFHYGRKRKGTSLERQKGNSGELNCNWNGGTSEYENHYELKKNRLEKLKEVNYICELCGKKATDTHHIDKTKENHATSNLLALCRKCHMSKFHSGPSKTSKFIRLYGSTLSEISTQLKIATTTVHIRHKQGKLTQLLTPRTQGQDRRRAE